MAIYRIFTNDRGFRRGVAMYSGFKEVGGQHCRGGSPRGSTSIRFSDSARLAIRWPESAHLREAVLRNTSGKDRLPNALILQFSAKANRSNLFGNNSS